MKHNSTHEALVKRSQGYLDSQIDQSTYTLKIDNGDTVGNPYGNPNSMQSGPTTMNGLTLDQVLETVEGYVSQNPETSFTVIKEDSQMQTGAEIPNMQNQVPQMTMQQ